MLLPKGLFPQHSIKPLVLTPQTLYVPARTGAKEPSGRVGTGHLRQSPVTMAACSCRKDCFPSIRSSRWSSLRRHCMSQRGPARRNRRAGLELAISACPTSLWRHALAVIVGAPAFDQAVGPHSTGVELARADRNEGTAGRRRLAIIVVSPAFHRAVSPQSAGVEETGADGGELPRRWRGRAPGITAPAFRRAVGPHSAGAGRPGADGDELPCAVAWPGHNHHGPSTRRSRPASTRRCGRSPR